MKNEANPISLARQLFYKLWDSLGPKADPKNIVRVVPLLFPILESTIRLQQVVTTPIRLVDRYLFDVVRQFGPMTATDVGNLLGLQPYRVELFFQDAIRAGAPLRYADGVYHCRGAKGPLKYFENTVSHEVRIIRSGVVNELFPITFLDMYARSRLNLQGDSAEQWLRAFPLLQSTTHGENFTLPDLLPQHTACLGIPEGFNYHDIEILDEQVSHFLAFALVTRAGTVDISIAGAQPFQLRLPGEFPAIYLKQTAGNKDFNPQHKTWLKRWLNDDTGQIDPHKLLPDGVAGSVAIEEHGICSVHLENYQELLNWDVLQAPDQGDRSKARWFCHALLRGWNWYPEQDFLIVNYSVTNPEAAKQLVLMRAALELQSNYMAFSDLTTLENWWDNWRSKNGGDSIPLISLLQNAVNIRDTEFQEYLTKAQGLLKSPDKPADRVVIHAESQLLTNLSPDNCHGTAVREFIESAKSRLELLSPMIDDDAIIDLLLQALKRGVKVYLLTELRHESGFRSILNNSENSSSPATLHKLAEAGAFIRCHKFRPHGKMYLADGERLILTSANLNTNSMGWGESPAHESGLILHHPDLAEAWRALFQALWDSCIYHFAYKQGAEGATYGLHEEGATPLSRDNTSKNVRCLKARLYTPENPLTLSNTLCNHIRKANNRVILTAMSLYDTRDVPDFHDALLMALHAGVEVIVLVRPGAENKFRAGQWPDTSTRELMEAGLQIRTMPGLHAKGIVIDDKFCGLYSGNLNPYSLGGALETGHIETGLFGSAKHTFLKPYAEYLRQLMARSSPLA